MHLRAAKARGARVLVPRCGRACANLLEELECRDSSSGHFKIVGLMGSLHLLFGAVAPCVTRSFARPDANLRNL